MRVRLAYFSGTGGTALITRAVAGRFRELGWDIALERIGRDDAGAEAAGELDQLILLFAVHDFNAPHPVADWLSRLPAGDGRPAAVISVSGGGEMVPNRACRKRSIEQLERLGYNVFHENMFVMPSSVIISHRDPVGAMLLRACVPMARDLADRLAAGEYRRTKPPLIDRAFAWLCRDFSAQASPGFCAGYQVAETCDNCGWCVKKCPTANIGPSAPVTFGDRCVMCLACVYGCPKQAISVTKWPVFRLKRGYSLPGYRRQVIPAGAWQQIGRIARGAIWQGTRRYLQQARQVLPPAT